MPIPCVIGGSGNRFQYVFRFWMKSDPSASSSANALFIPSAFAIVAGLAFMLAVGSYGGKPAGLILWPLFGTTNQLLASLVFATITIYLLKRKSPTLLTTIPLVLVSITTVCAMIWNIKSYIQDGNWILFVIGSTILMAGFVLIYLSCSSYFSTRKQSET